MRSWMARPKASRGARRSIRISWIITRVRKRVRFEHADVVQNAAPPVGRYPFKLFCGAVVNVNDPRHSGVGRGSRILQAHLSFGLLHETAILGGEDVIAPFFCSATATKSPSWRLRVSIPLQIVCRVIETLNQIGRAHV